ncbi:hypothetical protein MF265_05610 [Serratia marcescens]|uniref:hypothetical protein n=1 Tax=Serratia marcescens TaxID=615 RepID=UPI001EF01748|nr:hypothetical protein [Serratia marcescens]ULH12258.1 hypothetical protein MF265_05610 [Serratia marcescens]
MSRLIPENPHTSVGWHSRQNLEGVRWCVLKGKILKVKKWLDLNEAAARLSLAIEEPVSALDILELGIDEEVTLSIRLPYTHKYVVREAKWVAAPYVDFLKKVCEVDFSVKKCKPYKEVTEEYKSYEEEYIKNEYSKYVERIDSSSDSVPEHNKTYEYFINELQRVYLEYSDELLYLEGYTYELPMIGAERLDAMALMDINRKRKVNELCNLDGAFLRDEEGRIYNIMERFDDAYLKQRYKDSNDGERGGYLNPRDYFPADGLPDGCEFGISPSNLIEFERKLSDEDDGVSSQQLLKLLGGVLNVVTSKAKKWTQGDLAVAIAEKKLPNLGERVVNGLFSKANKSIK